MSDVSGLHVNRKLGEAAIRLPEPTADELKSRTYTQRFFADPMKGRSALDQAGGKYEWKPYERPKVGVRS